MIAVIVPTLNEEEAIGSVLQKFPDEYREHELKLYVVDGGSEDRTRDIAEEHGAEVILQNLGGGKGNGMRQAVNEIDAEYYLMLDGDGTYDPGEMDRLLDPLLDGEAEHIIGWRKKRSSGAIPALNLVGNRVFNLITSFSTGTKVHDMLSGYRAFTKESLNYTSMTRPGFGIETEMTFTAIENDVPVKEVPISYMEREGESKLNPLKDGWRIINTIIWSIRDMNPLKFFSTAALFCFVLALYPSYLTVRQYSLNGEIVDVAPALAGSVMAIIGLQFVILGLLSDQIKNVERRIRFGENEG